MYKFFLAETPPDPYTWSSALLTAASARCQTYIYVTVELKISVLKDYTWPLSRTKTEEMVGCTATALEKS